MINYAQILETLFYVVGGIVVMYPLLAYILSRLFVPMLGFTETAIPPRLPRGMLEKIYEFEEKSHTKREYIDKVWRFMTTRYHGKRGEFLKHPSVLWWNLAHSWKKTGFLPCTMMTYMARILLVKSKFFTKKDVRTYTHLHGFVLHQCLQVRVEDGWIYVDPWAEHLGYGIGRRLEVF